MKRLLVVCFLLFPALALAGDTVRATAGTPLRLPVRGVSAAYALDSDCADVVHEPDLVVITGKRACATHVVAVTGNVPLEFFLIVTPRKAMADMMRAAQLRARGVAESGMVSTSYATDPNELETSIDLSRTQGNHTASVSLSAVNGYGYGATERRTAIPRASIQFISPLTHLTILDSEVSTSLLTLDQVRLRGFHVENRKWFVHAGVASLTGFRQRLFDDDPDRTAVAGYRFSLGRYGSLTPSAQWISASSQYVAGRSGTIGSLLYNYARPGGLHLQLESDFGRGVALAGRLDYTSASDRLEVRVRTTPARFARLSLAHTSGFQGRANWTRRLPGNVALDAAAARDSYTLSGNRTHSNSNWSTRLQWRVRRFTLSGGYLGSTLSRPNASELTTMAFPAGVSWDSPLFGTSFQYQFRRSGGYDEGSHLVRNSMRLRLRSVTLTAYGSRQTQAPTMDYVLSNIPWLREALLSTGVSATTPEEIQQFINSYGHLISGGYIRDFAINVAPVHRQVGTRASWVGPKNRFTAALEWRLDDDQRVGGRVVSVYESGSLTIRLNSQTDFSLGATFFHTRSGPSPVRLRTFTFGFRRRLGNVPEFLNRVQERASIRGAVFFDEAGLGLLDTGSRRIAGVTVILDGTRRARTNASGYYSFGSVPAGLHTVEVLYEGDEAYLFTTPPQVQAQENAIVNFGIGVRRPRVQAEVVNDAGQPIAGVAFSIRGPESHRAASGRDGRFSLRVNAPGVYTVVPDAHTVPEFYAVGDLVSQQVAVEAGKASEARFVIRAQRSISGTIDCATTREGASLVLSPAGVSVPFDKAGRFVARDLAAGRYELVLSCPGGEVRRAIEMGPEPSVVQGVDLRAPVAGAKR